MKIVDKIKKIGIINIMLSVCGIILLGSVSILFGYSLCCNGLVAASSKQNVDGYYLIEADCFESYEAAVEYSRIIQTNGGAGFIRFDDGFKVFVACYESKQDATSVLNKIDGIDNKKIYNLELEDFNLDNGFSKNVNSVLKNNVISFRYSIKSLINSLIQLDKGEKREVDIRNCAILILEELKQQLDRFLDNFVKDSIMIKYRNYFYEFYENIERISKLEVLNVEFSAIAKYQTIACCFKLQDILKIV